MKSHLDKGGGKIPGKGEEKLTLCKEPRYTQKYLKKGEREGERSQLPLVKLGIER